MSIYATNWTYRQIKIRDLNAGECQVLLALAHMHNDETEQCTPSGDTIASMCRLDKRSVQRIARRLEQKQLVLVLKRSENGHQLSNQYALLGLPKKTPPNKSTGVTGESPDKEVTSYPVIDDEDFDFPSQEKMKRGF